MGNRHAAQVQAAGTRSMKKLKMIVEASENITGAAAVAAQPGATMSFEDAVSKHGDALKHAIGQENFRAHVKAAGDIKAMEELREEFDLKAYGTPVAARAFGQLASSLRYTRRGCRGCLWL